MGALSGGLPAASCSIRQPAVNGIRGHSEVELLKGSDTWTAFGERPPIDQHNLTQLLWRRDTL